MKTIALLKNSFLLTIQNPAWWWLGVILLSGFNSQWFLATTPAALWPERYLSMWQFLSDRADNVPVPLLWWVGLFGIAVCLFVLTVWAKSVLILVTAAEIKLDFKDKPDLHKQVPLWNVAGLARRYIGKVLAIQLLVIVIAGALVLLCGWPAWLFWRAVRQPPFLLFVTLVPSAIFVLTGIIMVQLGSLFVVLYGLAAASALKAAWDALRFKFLEICTFMFSMAACYILSFLVASALFFYARGLIVRVGGVAEFGVVTFIFTFGYVVWLAILNVFYNVAFVLFFKYLTTSTSLQNPRVLPNKQAVSGII